MKRPHLVLAVLALAAAVAGFAVWSLWSEDASEPIVTIPKTDDSHPIHVEPVDIGTLPLDPLEAPPPAPIEDEPEAGAGTAVFGTVLSPAGNPVRDAIVTLLRRRGGNPLAPGSARRVRPPMTTGKDGKFRFEKLEGGKGYLLHVEHGAYATLDMPGILLPPDVETKLGDVMLKTGAEIKGVVSRVDGAAIEGAQVRVVPTGGDERPLIDRTPTKIVLTDERGIYQFSNLTPGVYDVLALTKEYRQGQRLNIIVDSAGATAKVDFQLEMGSMIAGRVLDEASQPIDGARIEVREQAIANHLILTVLSQSDGTFRAAGLGPGKYRLRAQREGYSPCVVTDIDGGTLDVAMVMKQNVAITGFVVDADTNEPLKSFGLLLFMASKQGYPTEPIHEMQEFQRTKDGSFTLDDVPPGKFVIQGFANGYAPGYSEVITVGREHVHAIRVPLGKGGSISGHVVDAAGAAIAGATVRLLDNAWVEAPFAKLIHGARSQFGTTRSDEGGAFTFTSLSPGTYQVQASLAGRTTSSVKDIVVENRQVTQCPAVVLSQGGSVVGNVVDPGGLTIANAKVSLLAADGASVETQAGNDGRYEFHHVLPGIYSIAAQPPPNDPNAANPFYMILTSVRSKQNVTIVEGQEQRLDLLLRKN